MSYKTKCTFLALIAGLLFVAIIASMIVITYVVLPQLPKESFNGDLTAQDLIDHECQKCSDAPVGIEGDPYFKNYRKIEIGMTMEQVYDIKGQPNDMDRSDGRHKREKWTYKKCGKDKRDWEKYSFTDRKLTYKSIF